MLGAILQPDQPACSALVDVVGSVMISNATDVLLTQRGLVAAGWAAAAAAAADGRVGRRHLPAPPACSQ